MLYNYATLTLQQLQEYLNREILRDLLEANNVTGKDSKEAQRFAALSYDISTNLELLATYKKQAIRSQQTIANHLKRRS